MLVTLKKVGIVPVSGFRATSTPAAAKQIKDAFILVLESCMQRMRCDAGNSGDRSSDMLVTRNLKSAIKDREEPPRFMRASGQGNKCFHASRVTGLHQ